MGTISDKLTYLNDTKGLLKDSINSLGGEITSQTTFRNYATELDSIYSNLPKVSGTGSNIQLTPTIKGRITSTLKGNTFQQTYTGKNLFDINGNLMSSASGLTNTYNEDGSVTTTGVANSSYARITYAIEIDNRLEDGQQYTISQKEANANLYIQVTATNKSTSAKTYYSCGSVTSRTFTADLTNYTYVLQVQTGTTSSWGSSSRTITNYYMLEKNSSATSFEPYVGGIVSPNPDYPQEIQSATGLQTIVVSDGTNSQTKELNLGKNLFDKDNANILNAQINRTQLKLVGDTDARTLWIKIQPNTTYTVSKILSARFRVATLSTQPVLNANLTKYVSDDSLTSLTITSEANDKYLAVMYYNSTLDTLTPQQILDSIQIEVGSQATTYSPYFTPIKLNKIGTYQDYISGTPDNWVINRQVGKKVLNGSEAGWSKSSNTSVDKFLFNTSDYSANNSSLCNYFTYQPSNNIVGKWYNNTGVQFVFNYSNPGTTTLDQWKTWLNTHNLVLIQPLATETTEPINNQEIINQLNEIYYLQSYNGTTNITITSADLELIMSASALKGE